MPLLEVKDLRTYFSTRYGTAKAVDGVSFSVNPAETLGIVGESGCGKSVTALSILGLVPEPGKVVGGEILFDGLDLLKLSRAEMLDVRWGKIAMIFQDPMTSLNPLMTTGRQIQEALELHLGMTPNQALGRAAELLTLVGIPEAGKRLSSYPHQFSGGMRQRVMIAMALSCNPKLLIADEPTTALDVTIQAQIVSLVKRLRDEFKMAIIWITHDLSLLARLADRVMVMYAGNVAEEAAADALYESPHHPYTIGLLGSVPRLDDQKARRLASIEGLPPDLVSADKGCLFFERCRASQARCQVERPLLELVGPAHQAACWVASSQSKGLL